MKMNKLKKFVTILSLCGAVTSAMAQSGATATFRFLPLLSGYNVNATSNAPVALGGTNTEFTTAAGQIVYSLTNIVVNGTANTNTIAPDAFKIVSLVPDINGDINANATLVVALGNTNWIPVVVTNSFGQYFVTNWPLAQSQYPNWMYPGTTNTYPAYTGTATNVVTVSLYDAASLTPFGGIGPLLVNSAFPLWSTTSTFTTNIVANGTSPVVVNIPLPVSWTQHARHVYASVSVAPNSASNGGQILVNQIGILQPQ